MTSTNDEKDVKSNQTSGPKGKTYYIEIYKALEAALTSASPLSERTEALCAAWGRVYRLCALSATTTHAHLLAWLQRHTARVILQTEWQSPASAEFRDCLDSALLAFLQEAKEAASARNDLHSWETQLCQRAEWFRKTLREPWGHPVLKKLLDQSGPQPAHAEVLEWLKEERGVIFVSRLRQLAASKCNDLALTLTTAVMERVRATDILDERPIEEGEVKPISYRTVLTEQAGFTCDVWEILVDLEFILLHKMDRTARCIELAKQTPLRTGYQLVERLRTRLETSPRDKKLWKNGKDVATIIAQVIVTRCMVTPVCADTSRAALYCCTLSLVRLLPRSRLPAELAALAAPAATPRHLYILATATEAQCKEDMKPFVCELYVRAITAGMNELERLKHDAKKEAEARKTEQTIAAWFVQLGKLLSASARIKCECALTAFSMHPSPAMFDKLKDAPPLPVVQDKQEPIDEPKSEFGSWANDSHGQSNFVKTSETLKLKHSHKQTNVLSTALLTEGETLGLSAELCQDIAALLSGPRLKTLSWDMDREKLLEVCRSHMERTDCGTRTLTTELRFLNLDPNDWRHLPEEYDGEGDAYYGIERGYEHLVEIIPEPEPEPEEIWADAIVDSDVTATAESSSDEHEDNQYRKKKSRSRRSAYTSEENDPLSLTAENKDRQPSKERQTEKKPRKERPKGDERSKSKSKKKRETSQERRKEMKAQKKREKKERKKMENDDAAPKPLTSLSSLIGLKVCSSETIQPDLKMEKNMQKEKKKKPPVDNQRLSSESDSQVVYDGQFSMDELKSPPQPILQDVLAKSKDEMSPDTRTISPIVPVHSPAPRVDSPGYSTQSPVREDVRERITKLLAFRRQKNCYSSPLSSPIQSFTPEKLSTPNAQDFRHSSGGSRLDRPADSVTQPYESVIKSVPTVTSTVTSTSMSTPLVTPSISNLTGLVVLNNSAQIHPESVPSNVLAKNAYNKPATVISKSQFQGVAMTPTEQGQMPKAKQKPQTYLKKPPVKRQPKPKPTLVLPNYTHAGQKVEDWQGLIDQHVTKPQPAQELEPPRKIYGMKDFISLLQAEYTKIGRDPTVPNNVLKQTNVEEKSATRRIFGTQDFNPVIQPQHPKIAQNPILADVSKRSLDEEESSAKTIQRKQLEDAPKTFSRRTYYKNSKQKEALKQTPEQEAISNELERHIREFQKLKQLQSNGTITIGKLDATKASQAVNTSLSSYTQSNPVLVSFLNAPSPNKNPQAEVPRSNVPLTSAHMDQKEINSLLKQQNNLVGRSYAPIGSTVAQTLQFNNELKASAIKVPNATVTKAQNMARTLQYTSTLQKVPSAMITIGSTGVTPNIVRNLQLNNSVNKVPNAASSAHTSQMPNIAYTMQFNNTANKVSNATVNSVACATPGIDHTSQINDQSKAVATAAKPEKDNKFVDSKGFQNEFHKMIGQTVLVSNNKAYLEYDEEPINAKLPHPAVTIPTDKKDDQPLKSMSKTKTATKKPKNQIQNDLVSVMDALRAHKTPSRGPNALEMALQRHDNMRKQTVITKPQKINDKVVDNEKIRQETVATLKPTQVPENKIGNSPKPFDINHLIETEVAYQINAKNYTIPDPNKLIETVKSMLKKPDIITLTQKASDQSFQSCSSAQKGEPTVKKAGSRKAHLPKPQMKPMAVSKTVSMPTLVEQRAPVVIKKDVSPTITSTLIQKFGQDTTVKHFAVQTGSDSMPNLVETKHGAISLSNIPKGVFMKSANSQKGSKPALVQKRTQKGSLPVVQDDYPLLDELMDKELLEEIDELSSDEDMKSELSASKVQSFKTDVIARTESAPIESTKSKIQSADFLTFDAEKTQSYVGMRVVRPHEFEACTNGMPPDAYSITKASSNKKGNPSIAAANTSTVTVPISNIVLLRPNIVAYPTSNPVFTQGPVTSIIVNPTPNLAVYQTTQYAVPAVNQIIIGNATSVLNNNTLSNVASEVVITAQKIDKTDETPQFSKADMTKDINVGKIEAKPKTKIEILEQKTLNFDYRTRNKGRKVLHEVQEKQNLPPSEITIKKTEKNTVDRGHTVTIDKNEKVVRKYSESVIIKRQAILNRKINQRCFYPPIPLNYEPLNAATVIVESNSVQEISPSDSASTTSNLDDVKEEITKDVAKENAVNDGTHRRILLRSSNKLKAPDTAVARETKQKTVPKTKPKSAPIKGAAVDKNARPKRVSKRNVTKKSVLEKLEDKVVLPDAKVENAQMNELVDIEEQLEAVEIPKVLLNAKKSKVPTDKSKSEQQCSRSDLNNIKETNALNVDDNEKSDVIPSETEKIVSNPKSSNTIEKTDVVANATKYEDKNSESMSKDTAPEEVVSNAKEPKVIERNTDVKNASNVVDNKNVKDISETNAPEKTIPNAKRSTSVTTDSDVKCMTEVSKLNAVQENVKQNSKSVDTANLVSDYNNERSNTNAVNKLNPEEKSEDHIPQPRKIKRYVDKEPSCVIEIDDNEPLLDYVKNVKVHSVKIIPTKPGEPSIKCIKITLPNNKTFKVTVSGAQDVDISTLFANPAVQNIITSNWTRDTKYKLNVRHNPHKKQPFEVLNTTEVNTMKDTGAVIDLISDEEKDHKESMYLKTEFGIYKIATESIEIEELQRAMNQKCIVKLIKHPDSYFLSQKTNTTLTLGLETITVEKEERPDTENFVVIDRDSIVEISKETPIITYEVNADEVNLEKDKTANKTVVENDTRDVPVLHMVVDSDERSSQPIKKPIEPNEEPQPVAKEVFNNAVVTEILNKNDFGQEIPEYDRINKVDDVLVVKETVSCDALDKDCIIAVNSQVQDSISKEGEIQPDKHKIMPDTVCNNILYSLIVAEETYTDEEPKLISNKGSLKEGSEKKSKLVQLNEETASEQIVSELTEDTKAIETTPSNESLKEKAFACDSTVLLDKEISCDNFQASFCEEKANETLETVTTEEILNETEKSSDTKVCIEKASDHNTMLIDGQKTINDLAEVTQEPPIELEKEIVADDAEVQVQNIDKDNNKQSETEMVFNDIVVIDKEKSESTPKPAENMKEVEVDDVVFISEEVVDLVPTILAQHTVNENDNSDDVVFVNEETVADSFLCKELDNTDIHTELDNIIETMSNKIANEDEVSVKSIVESRISIVNDIDDSDSILPEVIELDSSSDDELQLNQLDIVIPNIIDLSDITTSKSQHIQPEEKINEFKNLLLNDLGVSITDAVTQTSITYKRNSGKSKSASRLANLKTSDPKLSQECIVKIVNCDELVEKYNIQKIIAQKKCFVQLVKCDHMIVTTSDLDSDIEFHPKEAPIRSGSPSILNNDAWDEDPILPNDICHESTGRTSPVMEIFDLISRSRQKNKEETLEMCTMKCTAEWFTTKRPENYSENKFLVTSELLMKKPNMQSLLSMALNKLNQKLDSPTSPSRKRKLSSGEDIVVMKKCAKDNGKDFVEKQVVTYEVQDKFKSFTASNTVAANDKVNLMFSVTEAVNEIEIEREEELNETLTSSIHTIVEQPEEMKHFSNLTLPAGSLGVLKLPKEINLSVLKPIKIDVTNKHENAEIHRSSLEECETNAVGNVQVLAGEKIRSGIDEVTVFATDEDNSNKVALDTAINISAEFNENLNHSDEHAISITKIVHKTSSSEVTAENLITSNERKIEVYERTNLYVEPQNTENMALPENYLINDVPMVTEDIKTEHQPLNQENIKIDNRVMIHDVTESTPKDEAFSSEFFELTDQSDVKSSDGIEEVYTQDQIVIPTLTCDTIKSTLEKAIGIPEDIVEPNTSDPVVVPTATSETSLLIDNFEIRHQIPGKAIGDSKEDEKTFSLVGSIAMEMHAKMRGQDVSNCIEEVVVSAKEETDRETVKLIIDNLDKCPALKVEASTDSHLRLDTICAEITEEVKEIIGVDHEDNVQDEVVLGIAKEPYYLDSESPSPSLKELLKDSLGCETSGEIVDTTEDTKEALEESEDTLESAKELEIQYVNSPLTPSAVRESSTPLDYAEQPGLILKGIEFKDPIVGTCYVFQPIDDSVSDTASVKTDLNESDLLNESTEDVNEILKITDDDEMNSPKEYKTLDSTIAILQENKIECALPESKEKEKSCDFDLHVKTPNRTYSPIYEQRSLKRKLSTTETPKQLEKKYRKGKRIDYPKLSAVNRKELSFSSEYKTLIDYIDSVAFSFSRPFHKDEVDVFDAFSNWPISGPVVNMVEDNSETCADTLLFKDVPDTLREETDSDPLNKSLVDDLSIDCLETEPNIEITSCDESETNFNMGFGEESGRVIQNLEEGGDISKFSAATLSDVKQTQPFLLSKSKDGENDADSRQSEHDQKYKLIRSIKYIQLKDKVRSFFAKIKLDLVDNSTTKDGLRDPVNLVDARKVFRNVPGLYGTEFLKPPGISPTVNVVQVGQLPVSAAAQNPVSIDPRVTQVSDASPSQCSVENSPRSDNNQATIKAEYTELTNADLSLPLVQDISEQNQSAMVKDKDAITPEQNVIPKEVEIRNEFKGRLDLSNENSTSEPKQQDPMDFHYENNTTNETTTNMTNDLPSNLIFNHSSSQQAEKSFVPLQKHENGSVEKTDQIAHAMNAAGITTTPETPVSRPHPLVNLLSQKVIRTSQSNAGQTSTNNYQKTSINAMALQQALAQILPPPLNQTSGSESGQQTQNTTHTPQVLHIVQGKNSSGNQITLVDNSQQSVISTPNATQVLHIVQNKSATGTTSNGSPNTQNFSGLSLVDAGLQQGGNQLLHIVNTGNQKNPSATGQLLKRVNLLTNLTNVQGGNEQKMVQFVCKSADGKAIHLNAPHQRSMVLRLQPIETPNVQANVQKAAENQELSPTQISNQSKEAANQQEIKSRSVYEENYAKFIQNSSTPKTSPLEKSTSLPKFNQAFGKATFQEGTGKQNEINTASHLPQENAECPPSENAINLDHLSQISSPPLLVRKAAPPTSQAQQNLVQQIKQSIAPMNMTMHGGVIYTRQIPVNIGGGQTINLITVPTTELIDENGQKQQSEIETPIIKIVPQTQPNSEGNTDDNAHLGSSTDGQQTPQPQQVLTQMRIKLPMLSKTPQVVQGARSVRPTFFQIQRNMIGGANQGQVYQQLVLTAAPPLGQQTIRLPQAAARQVKVQPETPSPSESQLSSSTLEQLREFDMVLEQVKERSTVQPSGSSNSNAAFSKLHATSTDTTDSNSVINSSTSTEHTQQVLYSIGNTSTMNVAYVNRKSIVTTPTTSTFVRSPDSSGIVDSPSSSSSQIAQTVTETSTSTTSSSSEASASTNQPKAAKVGSKSVKSRPKPATATPSAMAKVNNPIPPKTTTQKPLEDEQTTQRILYILAEYKEQVENSPDKDKPAPRRRSNPPSNPSGSSKRKKSSSGSRRHGCTRDHSPVGDDNCRTMGSEDSSCGTSQGDCTENCSIDAHSPQDSPRKVVRKLTFEQETPLLTQPRIQPSRNVIVADGQTITVARSATGKPTTAVLMPANYILPVSMMKGGQQIAIVTNRGPKLLTVGGPPGEAGAANALLLQRLIGPAGLKPVLARPGVRHVRLPATALHNLQAFNIQTAIPTAQPPDSTASPAPAPTPPDLVETRANSSPWAEREPTTSEVKPERGSSPEASEPWHLQSSTDAPDYTYEEPVTSRADNVDRTVLVVQKKDGSAHGLHRVTHISSAALRHKYAILEHELRLQKSLSEECEDLGVDSPSASELFPEAELLFAASPAHDHSHHASQQSLSQSSIPQPDMDDQIATDHLLPAARADASEHQPELTDDVNLGLGDGIVTVSEDGTATIALDQEEFARAHPNTTFHSEPTDVGEEVQPFSIASGITKGRHITSTIFHSNTATVLMTAPPQTVISQAAPETSRAQPNPVKYADLDKMINSLPGSHNNDLNLSSVLVKDDGLTRFDSILTDSRELHLSNTASAIVHPNVTQVIRRVCYDDETKRERERYLMDENDGVIAGDDAKMSVAEESSRDATMDSIGQDDENSSPERHAELFWESNSASERSESRRPLDFSSDSDKCCKSPSLDETNSTDSSGVGTHLRLDSVIKEARARERSGSADNSSADDTVHPPIRTYPPKRAFHNEGEVERSLSGKTRAGERSSPDSPEVRRRASNRGVVKRGCHCCNGSPAPARPKKPRQRKPTLDFTNSN